MISPIIKRKVCIFMKYEELTVEDLKRMQEVDIRTVNIEDLTDLRDIQIKDDLIRCIYGRYSKLQKNL